MKCYRRLILTACVIALTWTFLSPEVMAADYLLSLKSLAGIEGMRAEVKILSPALKKAELSEEKILAEMESRLKAAGIKLLTLAEQAEMPGRPCLQVIINGMSVPKTTSYCFKIKVVLVQDVILKRDPQVILPSGTLEQDFFGAGSTGDIMELAKVGIDMFVNDMAKARKLKESEKTTD